ncbi:DUF4190 domain-containing protein [Mycobacterium persicum]|uniref:DUF4190 domain-containing protein n=1 Tax=Mycobacterium persicum TaxID=1487726 RepID=A0A1X0LI18_9MYCO|nr:DUF4190 domain-containing protein [Mycobacterium persicum]KZS80250.1 hypothetical protein A4G31_26665 [Mycobacterium persicum]ORC09872.1 hypothetical protein B4U45_28010 [Mycobacterium persicum]VAZ75561.1 hypothetical protein LAUMK15_02863 [Mycobacterium persicum]VAZ86625.1 hypothetical protein LAUMK42_05477 [Mycobacterium persicum]VAZ93676.1 hypothetical protein LAUMK4_02538 [Mycobacterium persicum]
MTSGGYGGGSGDPFGAGSFDAGPFGGDGSVPGAPEPPSRPQGEINTLATLSLVFAFFFAPAGVVLGHVALARISRTGERGRDRALIGLTLSYVFILFAVVALVVWLVMGAGRGPSPGGTTTSTTPPTTATPSTSIVTSVVTAPSTTRPTFPVEDMRVGDCVEIQHLYPDPTNPDQTQISLFYSVPCEARDGVFRVDKIATQRNQCPGYALVNADETLVACVSEFRG